MPYIVIDLVGDEDTVIVGTTNEPMPTKQLDRPLVTDLVDTQLELVITSNGQSI